MSSHQTCVTQPSCRTLVLRSGSLEARPLRSALDPPQYATRDMERTTSSFVQILVLQVEFLRCCVSLSTESVSRLHFVLSRTAHLVVFWAQWVRSWGSDKQTLQGTLNTHGRVAHVDPVQLNREFQLPSRGNVAREIQLESLALRCVEFQRRMGSKQKATNKTLPSAVGHVICSGSPPNTSRVAAETLAAFDLATQTTQIAEICLLIGWSIWRANGKTEFRDPGCSGCQIERGL